MYEGVKAIVKVWFETVVFLLQQQKIVSNYTLVADHWLYSNSFLVCVIVIFLHKVNFDCVGNIKIQKHCVQYLYITYYIWWN